MNNRKLLVDYTLFEISPQQINESLTKNSGRLIVSGVLQRANAKNHNGRIYPKDVLMREATKYTKTFVSERRAMGELDHPDSSVVNLSNVSHNVIEMHWNGDDLVGTVEVLSTPAGNILKELFRSGIRLGISSRGLGSVKELYEEDGAVEVQPDFELIAFDFVSNPSTHGAFLSPQKMNEGVVKESIRKYNSINTIVQEIIKGA